MKLLLPVLLLSATLLPVVPAAPVCADVHGDAFGLSACVAPDAEAGRVLVGAGAGACAPADACAALQADAVGPTDAACAAAVAAGSASGGATCRAPPPPPLFVLRPVATLTWVPCPGNPYQNCGTITPGAGWSCSGSTSTASTAWATCTSVDPAFRCAGVHVVGSIPAARGFNVMDATASCGGTHAKCQVVYGQTPRNRCVAGAAVGAGSNVVGCEMFNSNYYHLDHARTTCYAF